MELDNTYQYVGGPDIIFRVPSVNRELIERSAQYVKSLNNDVVLKENMVHARNRLYQDNGYTLPYERDALSKLYDLADQQYKDNQFVMQNSPGQDIEIYRIDHEIEGPPHI